jgi:hypothetical protein
MMPVTATTIFRPTDEWQSVEMIPVRGRDGRTVAAAADSTLEISGTRKTFTSVFAAVGNRQAISDYEGGFEGQEIAANLIRLR